MVSALGPWRRGNVALASVPSQIEHGGRHTGMLAEGNSGSAGERMGKRAGARGQRLGALAERNAGKIIEQRSARGEDGPTCSPARTRSPAPPREAAAGEPPPPSPLFPIRARSSRRRAVVSPSPPLVLHRARHGAAAPPPFFLQQDPSRLLPLFPIRVEQPPEGCCVPAAASGPASSRTRAAAPPPVFVEQDRAALLQSSLSR
jgi:hypothetical protein